jgi:hypothetical protein
MAPVGKFEVSAPWRSLRCDEVCLVRSSRRVVQNDVKTQRVHPLYLRNDGKGFRRYLTVFGAVLSGHYNLYIVYLNITHCVGFQQV